MPQLFHYTSAEGYKSISSAPIWFFRAGRPPGGHPVGAYFTDYDQKTPSLAVKLRIPRSKLQCFFSFTDVGDLKRLEGGRGGHIFYSEADYRVVEARQVDRACAAA